MIEELEKDFKRMAETAENAAAAQKMKSRKIAEQLYDSIAAFSGHKHERDLHRPPSRLTPTSSCCCGSSDSFDEEDPNRIIILDGCNILKYYGMIYWHLLDAATSHYVTGEFKDIVVFLPLRVAHSRDGEYFALRWSGKATVVGCPHGVESGVIDDQFMIEYAKKKIREGRRVRIITDDNFRDHGVAQEWRRKNTGKFVFVGDEFVVKYPDIEVGTTSTRSTGVDIFQ